MLRHYGSVGASLDSIRGTFLRSNNTVDFVCVIEVRPADPWAPASLASLPKANSIR